MNISAIRHPREGTYYLLCAIFSILIYVILLASTVGTIILFALPFCLISWITGLFFKASLFGNALKVSEHQCPEIHKMVVDVASDIGMTKIPDVFIYNAGGIINAYAIKFIGGKYVMLFNGIVDLSLKRNAPDELKTIIAHELGHHAAGHTGLLKNLLIMPARMIPYLGNAYSRACEYTCDRIATAVIKDANIVSNALVGLAHGSVAIASHVNREAFVQQESEIPGLPGYINEIYSTHPRLTRRIKAVNDFARNLPATQG